MSRTNLTKTIRNACWMQNCGSCFEHECFVGCGSIITPFTYECGHIQAVAEGGSNSLDNLKPICSTCNKSMGSMHMIDYIEKCSFSPLWLQKQRLGSYKISFRGIILTKSSRNPINCGFRIIDGNNFTYLVQYPADSKIELSNIGNFINAEFIKDHQIQRATSIEEVIDNIKLIKITSDELFNIRSIEDVINDLDNHDIDTYLDRKNSNADLLLDTCKMVSQSILVYDGVYKLYLNHGLNLDSLNKSIQTGYDYIPIQSKDDFIEFYKLYAPNKIINLHPSCILKVDTEKYFLVE